MDTHPPIHQHRMLNVLCLVLSIWLGMGVILTPYAIAQGAAGRPQMDYTVLIVLSQEEGVYNEVVAGMRASMPEKNPITLQVLPLAEFIQRGDSSGEARQPDIILSVGTQAAKAVLSRASNIPVYVTLLPRLTYETLLQASEQTRRARPRSVSGIYIDQPFQRQAQLIRLTLPKSRNLGVVYGALSRENEKRLRVAADSEQFSLYTETIQSEHELFGALTRVLGESDVLLALPDPGVFNKHTTQNILLETYRQQKPVIGYSHAYVAAGALTAVYSTPHQIGRQAGEELLQLRARGGNTLPPPHYPRYFTVEVNERVARSLGVTVASAPTLQAKLEETEEK